MRLSAYLDSLAPDRRAYAIAEASWNCGDDDLSAVFMAALADEGRAYVDAILATLQGGAAANFSELLEGLAIVDAPRDMSSGLEARLAALVADYEGRLDRSAAAKARARADRRLLASNWRALDGIVTDQMMGIPFPAVKPMVEGALTVALPDPDRGLVADDSLYAAISGRESLRAWADSPLSLGELSWLLFATQGLRDGKGGRLNLRTVPSAGSRHALESYVAARRVEGLKPGLWRYLPATHGLELIRKDRDLGPALEAGACGQAFVGQAPICLIWTALPYRMEWRYCGAAAKLVLLDAGHVCQNLYLAAGAIGCGTCAIGAYDQALMDALVGADGEDEFVTYMAPVGKRPEGQR